MFFAPHQIKGAMSQKPVTMEQLKQILQLKNDGVPIRQIALRIGISRNSVRKYLAVLANDQLIPDKEVSNKELADKAYKNDLLEHSAQKLEQLIQHFQYAQPQLAKTGVQATPSVRPPKILPPLPFIKNIIK